jgi:hemerythrin
MAFMEWTSRYSIGVAIFDDEHKKLFAIINDLHDAIEAGVEKSKLRSIADRMIEYAIMHLQHEEMYFNDWDYPHAEEHKKMHNFMKQRVFGYRARIEETDETELAKEMLEFLRNWLSQHILIEDRKYGDFLLSKGLR